MIHNATDNYTNNISEIRCSDRRVLLVWNLHKQYGSEPAKAVRNLRRQLSKKRSVILIIAFVHSLASCSLVTLINQSDGSHPAHLNDCPTYVWPILDTTIGTGMLVFGGIMSTADIDGDCNDPVVCAVLSEFWQVYGVSLLVLGLLFEIAAACGYMNVYSCRKEVSELRSASQAGIDWGYTYPVHSYMYPVPMSRVPP
jgi:hypothetical protein